jgi:hypothetical protein
MRTSNNNGKCRGFFPFGKLRGQNDERFLMSIAFVKLPGTTN